MTILCCRFLLNLLFPTAVHRHRRRVRFTGTAITRQYISRMIPGECEYTLNRAIQQDGAQPPRFQTSGFLDLFSSIIVEDSGHISPPEELWICHNISLLDFNIGRPIPLFRRSCGGQSFTFIGCYRILRYESYAADSDTVRMFIDVLLSSTRPELRRSDADGDAYCANGSPDSTRDEHSVTKWARVELEKVTDHPILSGNPRHQYVMRYAFSILQRKPE